MGKMPWYFISQGDFDVIVLDIMMPEMDGLEVLRVYKGKTHCYTCDASHSQI